MISRISKLSRFEAIGLLPDREFIWAWVYDQHGNADSFSVRPLNIIEQMSEALEYSIVRWPKIGGGFVDILAMSREGAIIAERIFLEIDPNKLHDRISDLI